MVPIQDFMDHNSKAEDISLGGPWGWLLRMDGCKVSVLMFQGI